MTEAQYTGCLRRESEPPDGAATPPPALNARRVLFKEAAAKYLEYMQQRQVRTLENKRDKMRWFTERIGHMPLVDVTDEVVALVIEKRAEEGKRRRPIRGRAPPSRSGIYLDTQPLLG